MSDDALDKRLARENVDRATKITAADFQPLQAVSPSRWGKLRSLLLRPAGIAVAVALLLSAAVLWFLLTAKALMVDVRPLDAQVSIHGGPVLALSGNYLLRPGQYRLEAVAEGYQDYQVDFRVSSADSQRLEVQLEKKPGHLELKAIPEGVDVLIDQIARGKTPLLIKNLTPGSHTLQLSAARYFPVQKEVVIEGMDKTQQLEISLRPAWGELVLSSSPAGATVRIGGEERGVTPLSTQLLQQGETVELSLAGYKTWQRQLSIAAGETLEFETVELQPNDGLVVVKSNPPGASVTVNGVYRGVTPVELAVAPDEQNQLTLFLDGYQTAKRSLQMTAGETRELTVALAANTGAIRVLAEPKGAEIWIDGKLRGDTSVTLELPAKAHRLEVRKAGYAAKTQLITPKPGLQQVLRVNLLTEKAARWASIPRTISSPGGQQLKLFKPEQTFTMGASRREIGRRSNEVMKEVRLERGFYLATTEVTNSQFKAFASKHSSSHASQQTLSTPTQPVVNVSWNQAALYCNWLSEQEGLPSVYRVEEGKVVGFDPQATGYRLPTEAEWAWAARYQDGAMKKYAWGDTFPPTEKVGNYADIAGAKVVGRVINTYNDGFVVSAPVGSFPANEKGLFDLDGNVSEWVNDFYGIDINLSGGVEVDPTGPEKGEFRVVRGASWRHGSQVELRLSYRDYADQGRDDVGFRVARYAE